MNQSRLSFTADPAATLLPLISPGTFLLADSNTSQLVVPRLVEAAPQLARCPLITIDAGDDNKSLDSLALVWRSLTDAGATRSSTLVNIGGGMVTDLGGFAAATFKRGMRHINIPTTLLGAVDAAVGGKTGINFAGFKNEIGAFAPASDVIVSTCFFTTLPHVEMISGYAEMIKHALIHSPQMLARTIDRPVDTLSPEELLPLLRENILVKQHIVTEDPREQGIRRALNLGHTAAHAFESLAMKRGYGPIPHGVAVAWGLVVDMVLSHMLLHFPSATLRSVADFIVSNYPAPRFTCNDYPDIIDAMTHDKKNVSASAINFTLLRQPGDICIDMTPSTDDIRNALDITRDIFHI